MWTMTFEEDVGKRLKKFQKKWQHEVANVLANVEIVLKALNSGVKPEQLKKLGFVRSEPSGVLAIDQKGPGKGSKLKELRLYVFPIEDELKLHAITLGDKSSQQKRDIEFAVRIVDQINRRKSQSTSGDELDSREAV